MDDETRTAIDEIYTHIDELKDVIAQIDGNLARHIEHLGDRIKRLYGLAGAADARLMKLEQE